MGLFTAEMAPKTMVPVCRQLATAYDAGIPIVRALEMTAENVPRGPVREVLLAMSDDVRRGATLEAAARKHNRRLPRFFIELLAAGELGGQLDVMLRDLADYYENRLTMRRRIIGAMIYPGLQLGAAWYLGSFALGLIRKIDFSSRTNFSLDAYFQWYAKMQGVATLVFVGLFFLCVVLARAGLFGWIWGWVTNFVWPIKNVTRKFALARFFRSLSLLLTTGLDIRRCVQYSAAVTANPYIEQDLLGAVRPISEGASLTQAFGTSRYLTRTGREMLLVGEQSGNLEGTLRKVADYHFEEAMHAVQVATRVLGVVIVLGIGALVGYIVISFYASYFGAIDKLTNF